MTSTQDSKNFNFIRLAGVIRESIVDGPGLRFTVFCQGCPHGCEGCHNPDTHDFNGGYDCEISKITAAIDENPLLDGVTFSGGEPMCQPEAFLNLAVNVNRGGYQAAYSVEEQIFETREQLLRLFHFTSGKGKNKRCSAAAPPIDGFAH